MTSLPKLWPGATVWIIGGGYSMPFQFGVPEELVLRVCVKEEPETVYTPFLQAQLSRQGHYTIGVNNAYQLGAEVVDVVFFGDSGWWLVHQKRLQKWPGLIMSCCPYFGSYPDKRVYYMPKDRAHTQGISTRPGVVAWNHNSGAAAINLAVQFGAKRIRLLGFDMQMLHPIYSHWHGAHVSMKRKLHNNAPLQKVPFARHLRGFAQIAKDAERLGIEILNVNSASVIPVFPQVTLAEALQSEAQL